jgi:hypothetical protein
MHPNPHQRIQMTIPSLPVILLSIVIAAAAAADPQKSYTADSKLTDQLPDRSSKGDGPKVRRPPANLLQPIFVTFCPTAALQRVWRRESGA